ncbi:MAG: hypothetical protein R2739_02850 [Chitinophagales bacterium]|nr:hypothetical protein [Bacteroidota bacterium]
MQIRGKILTIAGIVLVFGYFILDSFRVPSFNNPDAIIMSGNDTLGRDWGAIADQREQEGLRTISSEDEEGSSKATVGVFSNQPLVNSSNDPFLREKLNTDNYSTQMSPDGREIVTGYDNPYGSTKFNEKGKEDDNENDLLYDNEERYKTRHQIETSSEPQMKYRL